MGVFNKLFSKKKKVDNTAQIAKPQFITNKDKDENFVELDKNEDVSILLNNIYIN